MQETQGVYVQVSPEQGGREHVGAIAVKSRAVLSAPHGGQVICDSATLEGIKGHLAELYSGRVGSGSKLVMSRVAR